MDRAPDIWWGSLSLRNSSQPGVVVGRIELRLEFFAGGYTRLERVGVTGLRDSPPHSDPMETSPDFASL